ncbi:MAG: hypothetical protein ACKPGQ_04025, partial [Dolichospermum sp.]
GDFVPHNIGKCCISIGIFFGSIIGSYIPLLWDLSLFSITSILFNIIGGNCGNMARLWYFQIFKDSM